MPYNPTAFLGVKTYSDLLALFGFTNYYLMQLIQLSTICEHLLTVNEASFHLTSSTMQTPMKSDFWRGAFDNIRNCDTGHAPSLSIASSNVPYANKSNSWRYFRLKKQFSYHWLVQLILNKMISDYGRIEIEWNLQWSSGCKVNKWTQKSFPIFSIWCLYFTRI